MKRVKTCRDAFESSPGTGARDRHFTTTHTPTIRYSRVLSLASWIGDWISGRSVLFRRIGRGIGRRGIGRRIGTRAVQIAHAHGDEIHVLPDGIVRREFYVRTVAALPLVAE